MTSRTTSVGTGTSPLLERLRKSEGVRHLARFGVIGVTSVLIDLAVYAPLTDSGVLTHPAKAISYLAGMAFGFVGNKFWTFGSRRKSASEPLTYVLIYAVTLAVNVGVNAAVLWLTGEKLAAFFVATGLTTVLNFLGLRWVTFREGVRQRRDQIRTEGA